jgi:chaperonin cofactor prefoldin
VAIGTERGELAGKKERTPEDSRRLDRIEKDLAAQRGQFEQFFEELPQHFSAKPVALQEQLRETEGILEDLRELPAGTVAIYTLVGEDKFRAILRTPRRCSRPTSIPSKPPT